ncbi:MAG: Na+/H+ antiporter subunit D [Rhizobium sp.]|nr:Na+/H+ antiporter subunit D [Rhizobium sp.]
MAASPLIDTAGVFVADPSPASWLVVLPVVLCLIGGAALAAMRQRIHLHGPIAIACLALLCVIDLLLLLQVATHGPMTMVMGRWLPPFGIAFTVDILGASFALVAGLVALGGAIYALPDIDTMRRRYGFFPFLLFLMAGVSGAFLTGDIFNLYVWFEVLLISSFGLIVLGGESEQIDGAMKYGLLNLVGTTLFLIAIGYLYGIFGTLNMADIAMKVEQGGAVLPLMTLGTLFFAAFAMKAAAFPVNFWLPASYHTPRITVSALFAGLLTKVGVYAMLRVLVMLMPATMATLSPLVGAVAVVTMLSGAIGAIAQSDIRRALGYWVISGIGIMLAGLAIGENQAISAAIFYAFHSMVVMSALYFAAGFIAERSGTYQIGASGGLWASSPLLSALVLALFLSVAGLPPFSGFWPKAMLVSAALSGERWWLAAAILLSGFLITFAAGRIFLLAFWRPAPPDARTQDARLPSAALAVLVLLTLASAAAGLWPEPVAALSKAAASAVLEPDAYLRSVFPEPRP